eukprot:350136-Chlamydomonas_euryale.AAC.22
MTRRSHPIVKGSWTARPTSRLRRTAETHGWLLQGVRCTGRRGTSTGGHCAGVALPEDMEVFAFGKASVKSEE